MSEGRISWVSQLKKKKQILTSLIPNSWAIGLSLELTTLASWFSGPQTWIELHHQFPWFSRF